MQDKIIVISDLHIKNKEPYLSSIEKFLQYIYEKYPNNEIIQLGDLFDASTIHADILYDILSLLKKFKKFHILTGNHDASYRLGSILKPLKHYNNLIIYDDITEVEIKGKKCLMLPFLYSNRKERIEKIEGNFDYIFTHLEHQQIAFDKENSIDFNKNLKGTFIHGHIHYISQERDYIDKNNNQHYILGCPIPTRHLEDKQEHRIAIIDEKINFEKAPFYFKYENINYGIYPESKNNILNIKNAPSVQDVLTFYKDYYIREDGIELKLSENSEQTLSFDSSDLKIQFEEFCKEENIDKELKNFTLGYL